MGAALIFKNVGILISLLFLALLSLKGFYKFYSKLRLYHKPSRAYCPIISISDRLDKEKIEDMGLDLELSNPQEELYRYESEIGDVDPAICVHISEDDEGQEQVIKREFGETLWLKLARLWFFTFVTVTAITLLIVTAFGIGVLEPVLGDSINNGTGNISVDIHFVMPLVLILSVLHLSVRYASFLSILGKNEESKRYEKDEESDTYSMKRVNELHGSAYSFIVSLIFIWAIVISVSFLGEGDLPQVSFIIHGEALLYLLPITIGSTLVINTLGEYILYKTYEQGGLPEGVVDEEVETTKLGISLEE